MELREAHGILTKIRRNLNEEAVGHGTIFKLDLFDQIYAIDIAQDAIGKEENKMNETNRNMQTMWFAVECQQINENAQGWVHVPTLLEKTKKQISKSLKKIAKPCVRFGVSYLVADIVARIVVPIAYNSRGYAAVGIEFVLVFLAFIATYIFLSPRGRK